MQRGAVQRIECGWHLSFALISRVRRLSARNPGPASPVETYHPRVEGILYPILSGWEGDWEREKRPALRPPSSARTRRSGWRAGDDPFRAFRVLSWISCSKVLSCSNLLVPFVVRCFLSLSVNDILGAYPSSDVTFFMIRGFMGSKDDPWLPDDPDKG